MCKEVKASFDRKYFPSSLFRHCFAIVQLRFFATTFFHLAVAKIHNEFVTKKHALHCNLVAQTVLPITSCVC